MIVKGRYVVPVDSPPIDNGCVQISHGLITGIGLSGEHQDSEMVDYGDAVICPGFVNAHTHLELSGLADRVAPSSDFVDWLRRLVDCIRAQPPTRENVQEAVRSGIEQSIRSGVTLVGDITSHPQWSREMFSRSPLRSVSYGEVISIGKMRDHLHDRLDNASSQKFHSDHLRVGISPHAPYTVEPDAMRACVDRARSINAPLCIHIAETSDEEDFIRIGQGVFVDYLKSLNVWDEQIPISRCNSIELAHQTGMLTSNTILAHANYVSDDDIRLLGDRGCHVAYCPRTHHAFDHSPHRFRELLLAGVNVCLGTDSLASNPSLSILEELRFLREQHPDIPPSDLLAMGTIRGAQALGYADVTGSLAVGKAADLVVIPLEQTIPVKDWSAILDTTKQPSAVYLAGELVYENHLTPMTK